MTVLAVALILAGVFFLTVSCIGLVRLPDFYARTHAVGKSETLGAILVLGGLAVYSGLALSTAKLLIILIFVLIANPAATHVVARAALRSGLEPWTKEGMQPGSAGDSGGRSDGEKNRSRQA
ncbi:MAG: monovalent cation/H(+) antiporter subunit G [Chloroflexota bacterium]